MRDPNWKCQRSGNCCRYIAGEDEWTYGKLNKEQKKAVEKQMEPVERGCEALATREGTLVCLNQYLFGLEAKPEGCRDFVHRCGMTIKVKELVDKRVEGE